MQRKGLYFLGDLHCDFEWLMFKIGSSGIRNSSIIQVGDFGLGFLQEEDVILSALNELCKYRNVTLYVVRGNHDDPARFNSGEAYSNLKFLKDYSILTIDGTTILLAGGAISIDRLWRQEGKTYWRNEKFSYRASALSQIKREVEAIDIVVTHSAPREAFPFTHDPIVQRYLDQDPTLDHDLALDRLEHSKLYAFLELNNLAPHFWYYGHFHKSNVQMIGRTRFQLLGINEMVLHKN